PGAEGWCGRELDEGGSAAGPQALRFEGDARAAQVQRLSAAPRNVQSFNRHRGLPLLPSNLMWPTNENVLSRKSYATACKTVRSASKRSASHSSCIGHIRPLGFVMWLMSHPRLM